MKESSYSVSGLEEELTWQEKQELEDIERLNNIFKEADRVLPTLRDGHIKMEVMKWLREFRS